MYQEFDVYQVSETPLTASWKRIDEGVPRFQCENCGRTFEIGDGVRLGEFCPRCGFRMTNPGYVTE